MKHGHFARCRGMFLMLSLSALVVLASAAPALAQKPSTHQGKILAGYFEEWSIYYANYNIANLQNNGVADKLSHLFYAFANVSAAASPACVLADPWADYQTPWLPSVNGQPYTNWPYGNFGAMIQLKQLHPNMKILISLGGASAANTTAFATAASTDAGRQALAASCIDMFIKGNVGTDWAGNPVSTGDLFDGFNIDWEFPAAADKQNFTLLLKEFRKELDALGATTGKHYQLSFDGPAGAQNYTNIELAKAARQVDFITIDGYNYAGSWDTVTNHASPLFDSRKNPDFGQGLYIESTVEAYLKAGVPPRKYVMGLPLYGAGWAGVPNVNHGLYQTSTGPAPSPAGDTLATNGVATYMTLSSATGSGYKRYFDAKRVAVTLYDPDTQVFWTYDDPFTATLKMLFVDLRVPGGLGGAFVWALKDDDANGTMVKTMATGLGR